MIDSLRKTATVVREARKMTQQQLADQANLTQAQISEFESGRRTLTLEGLERLCQALDLDLMMVPSERADEVLGILEEEGIGIEDALPTPLMKHGHLLLLDD